jgi:hypothetical protein
VARASDCRRFSGAEVAVRGVGIDVSMGSDRRRTGRLEDGSTAMSIRIQCPTGVTLRDVASVLCLTV